jgi:hypothetical protein
VTLEWWLKLNTLALEKRLISDSFKLN